MPNRPPLSPCQQIERSLITKYRKTIWNRFVGGIKDYRLIQPGDHIAVCISGGKDSMLLACCMRHLQQYSDFPFSLEFLVMDPGYRPANRQLILHNAQQMNLPLHVFDTQIFDVVADIPNPPATSAPGCAGAAFTPKPGTWAATKSPWATTWTMP